MSVRYLDRLRELLVQTETVASSLRPEASETASDLKGVPGALAHAVQGLPADEAAAVAEGDPAWAQIWKSEHVGEVVVYGVSLTVAVPEVVQWVAEQIAPQALHIKVFEADVAAMDISLADRIVKVRGRMRALRQRCELCFRILAAMENRGRKVTPPAIEKLKLALEKAEATERKKDERRKLAEEKAAAAERARLAREKRKEEAAEKKSAKKSSAQKKEREKSATKSFMLRFVKKAKASHVVSSLNSGLDSAAEVEKAASIDSDVILVPEACRASGLSAYKDRSVLPVSRWLTLRVPFDYNALENTQSSKNVKCEVETFKQHLAHCAQRRVKLESDMGGILARYRRERGLSHDERTPRFSIRRSDLRGRGTLGPIQLLQFEENHRPAFVGTTSRRSAAVNGRRPFAKDKEINYDYDSEDEWEEEAEDGESLSDVEVDKETAKEDAELRQLYGSDDEEDDDDFLDDENAEDEHDGDDEEGELDPVEIAAAKEHVSGLGNQADKHDARRAGTDTVMVDKPPVDQKTGVVDIDAWLPSENKDGTQSKKRPLSGSKGADVSKKRRRRKQNVLNRAQVQIVGISYGDTEKPSILDKFPVRAHVGAPAFEMYDPAVEQVREREAAASKAPKPTPPVRQSVPKMVLDACGLFDLATLIHRQSTGREKLVHEFRLLREGKGQEVPSNAAIQRTILALAVREKRNDDSRALYYLHDKMLEDAVVNHLSRVGRPKVDYTLLSAPVLAASAIATTSIQDVPMRVTGSDTNRQKNAPGPGLHVQPQSIPSGVPGSHTPWAGAIARASETGPGLTESEIYRSQRQPPVVHHFPSSAAVAPINCDAPNAVNLQGLRQTTIPASEPLTGSQTTQRKAPMLEAVQNPVAQQTLSGAKAVPTAAVSVSSADTPEKEPAQGNIAFSGTIFTASMPGALRFLPVIPSQAVNTSPDLPNHTLANGTTSKAMAKLECSSVVPLSGRGEEAL